MFTDKRCEIKCVFSYVVGIRIMSIHVSCDMYLRLGLHVPIRLYYVLLCIAKDSAQHRIGFILDRCIMYLGLIMPNLQKKRLIIFEIFNIKKCTLFLGTEYVCKYLHFYGVQAPPPSSIVPPQNSSDPSLMGKKTLWEKEKMLATSIFSFSHNVFNGPNCTDKGFDLDQKRRYQISELCFMKELGRNNYLIRILARSFRSRVVNTAGKKRKCRFRTISFSFRHNVSKNLSSFSD